VFTACSPSSQSDSSGSTAEAESPADTPSPEERIYLQAARSFFDAVASRDYAAAYGQLSAHARARMSLNQFVPSEDDALFARQEAQPRRDVGAADFSTLMAAVEKEHGQPASVRHLQVFETDPEVLSGKGEKLDVMFAIGNMPTNVPIDIRRASIRGQINTTLSNEQLTAVAKDLRTTVEELQKDPDFQPYFNLKLVLVEQEGSLQVAYFEFLPPSMLD